MIIVYITTKDISEARSIGRVLVEEHLASCVNIITGMESIYHWDGSICEASEVVLIAKTKEKLLAELTAKVKSLHTYTCPCIVALPIIGGNNEFLDWIGEMTKK